MEFRNSKTTGAIVIASILLILMLILAGCNGNSSGDDDDQDSSASPPSEADRNAGGGQSGSLAYGDDGAEGEGAMEEQSADAVSPNYVANQAPFDRLIVRTVNIRLTVEDVAQVNTWVRDLASRRGGFVFSSNTYVHDESEFAEVTIRVPADQLDSTIGELRDHDLVIQVDSEESSSQDVSQEYVDNESRLQSLEEAQRRFLELLSEADTVEEILRIESELTNIRTQIETIKGRQNYLDQMTSFSTVTIAMHGEGEDPDDEDDESFIAAIFGDAWDDARGVIQGLLGAAITLSIIGTAALPFALILYFIGRFAYRKYQGPTVVEQPAPQTAEESAS